MDKLHPLKEWDETIRLALTCGWTHEKRSGHTHSVLKCPQGICAEIVIYSTGRSTENVARTSRQKVKRCRHSDDCPSLTQVTQLLDGAERLITAATLQLNQRDNEQKLEELCASADESLQACEAELEKLMSVEESLNQQLADHDDSHRSIPENLADSGNQLKEASATLKDPRIQGSDFDPSKKRLHDLGQALKELHQRMKSF